MKMNGPEKSAILLMNLGEETSTKVLVSMDEEDPSMVDEILNWKFTFEDILRIDVNRVQNEGLLVSIKTAMDELKETLFSNVLEREAVILKEDLEFLSPMKTSEVEKDQQNIIYMCKQLEENRKTLIGGGEALV
jgi:flagellar motor switch protein FliG